MNSNKPNILLSAAEAATLLGVHRNTLYLYCQHRLLPFVRVGKFLRFDQEVLAGWLQSSHVNPEVPAKEKINAS